MKTEKEVREKISEYMDRINGKTMTALDREWYYGIIDALLWVVEDDSAKKI